jgi:hypothetical protein
MIELTLSELIQKSFSELAQLPPYQGTKTQEGGKRLTISIWKDFINDGEIRVVVQVYRQLFFGIGRMTAEGFRINSRGVVHKLSREELYDFT